MDMGPLALLQGTSGFQTPAGSRDSQVPNPVPWQETLHQSDRAMEWGPLPSGWYIESQDETFITMTWASGPDRRPTKTKVLGAVACWVEPSDEQQGHFQIKQMSLAQLRTAATSSHSTSTTKLVEDIHSLLSFFWNGSEVREVSSAGGPVCCTVVLAGSTKDAITKNVEGLTNR